MKIKNVLEISTDFDVSTDFGTDSYSITQYFLKIVENNKKLKKFTGVVKITDSLKKEGFISDWHIILVLEKGKIHNEDDFACFIIDSKNRILEKNYVLDNVFLEKIPFYKKLYETGKISKEDLVLECL